MANRRMISKSISTSEKLTKLYNMQKKDKSFPVLLFTWLQPHLDDWGRCDGTAFWIQYNIVPTLKVSRDIIERALRDMESVGLIIRYNGNDKLTLQVLKFEEHQIGLNKRTKSLCPDPPEHILKSIGLNLSETDVENYIYNNLETIDNDKIKSIERQVRIDNYYLDILAITELGLKWIIEVKRSKLSDSGERQLTNYLDITEINNGILIGPGITSNYSPTDSRIALFVFNEDMEFKSISIDSVRERSLTFKDVQMQGKGREGNLTEENPTEQNQTEEKEIRGKVTPEHLFKIYKHFNKNMNNILKLTDDRRKKCRERLKDSDFVKNFTKAVRKAQDIPFMTGSNNRGWRGSFDFLIKSDGNVLKVLEDYYDNHKYGDGLPWGEDE